MKIGALVGACALSACGSVQPLQVDAAPDAPPADIDASVDAGPDGPVATRCRPSDPFGTARLVAGVNSTTNDSSLRLDAMGLTGILAREGIIDGVVATRLFTVTRASKTAAFGTPMLLGGPVNDAEASRGQLSVDGLRLVMESNRGGQFDVLLATRNTPNATFESPRTIPNVDTPATEGQPFVTRVSGTLWFFRNNQVFAAAPVGNGFGVPMLHDELGLALAPTLTADELEIFFMNGMDSDIYHATRPSTDVPFGATSKLPELMTPSLEQPSDVSPDGCELYFYSDRIGGSGGYDIWVAERPQP